MSLTESIVKDAALTWFGEQTRCARTLIPTFSQREKEAIGHGPQMAPGVTFPVFVLAFCVLHKSAYINQTVPP
jgi:hypothetical protein